LKGFRCNWRYTRVEPQLVRFATMNTPDPLDRLVAAWEEPTAPSPDLRRRVWRRIEAAEARRPAAHLSSWVQAFSLLFRQRSALAWVMLCIALGLVSAELRATRTPLRDIGQMATLYLQEINPLLRAGTGGPR
jgi:hypothetical protein